MLTARLTSASNVALRDQVDTTRQLGLVRPCHQPLRFYHSSTELSRPSVAAAPTANVAANVSAACTGRAQCALKPLTPRFADLLNRTPGLGEDQKGPLLLRILFHAHTRSSTGTVFSQPFGKPLERAKPPSNP